jgi:hypothetical protein
MKVHIDIDCTPEEARTFFGLPDLQPMQEAVTWLPAGIANLEQMQKAFWQQFAAEPKKK